MKATSLPRVFHVPLEQVNPLLQLLVMFNKEPFLPDWLDGCWSITQVPRYVEGASFEYHGNVDYLSNDKIAGRLRWVADTLNGPWNLDEDGFNFERLADAMQYKLKFGGKVGR